MYKTLPGPIFPTSNDQSNTEELFFKKKNRPMATSIDPQLAQVRSEASGHGQQTTVTSRGKKGREARAKDDQRAPAASPGTIKVSAPCQIELITTK
ncbi:hypothetical protein BaRGS_00016157 [Batillaria attramentaria]|uniref:Uncharacterized protein n=1 Tax=Batillaria attramentaria TaxID=370345 RepID=A0ABD0L0D5_9CAEN